MRKRFFSSLFIASCLLAITLITSVFVQAYSIESGFIVTTQDIHNGMQLGGFVLDLPNDISVNYSGLTSSNATIKLFGLIPIRQIEVKVLTNTQVNVGGELLGFDIKTTGVEVLGFNSVLTREGERNPIQDIGIKKGDLILSINNKKVNSLEEIDKILNGNDAGEDVALEYMRDGKIYTAKVIPQKDMLSGKYKLGLWVKNGTNGVGTLTYVKSDGRYGAVGHAITDGITKGQTGEVYKAKFLGVEKATKNAPGEINASIQWSNGAIGDVDTNSSYGLFGQMKKDISTESIELGSRFAVKPGKAYIRTQVSDEGVKDYEIKIIKAVKQKKASDKSIVFKVVDQQLLNLTNGVIQGMSGSPIIQDGYLVGSVTHVFLNDATRGYGVYIDWMLQE